MAFPRKHKALLETKREQVEEPETVWLAYAVCGIDTDSCGWGGWILESAEAADRQLPAYTLQVCPSCNKELFRTEVVNKYHKSKDHTPKLVPGIDYELVPIEYEYNT